MNWENIIETWSWLWELYYGIFGLSLVILAIILRNKVVRLCLAILGGINVLPKAITQVKEATKMQKPLGWLFVTLIAHGYVVTRHELFYLNYLATLFRIFYIAIIAWLIINIIHQLALQPGLNTHANLPSINQTMRNLLHRSLSILVGGFAIMMIISELGYDMNGLLAGIGLGGLAVALAAQDMVANLFGCMVIVFDKPFELGDWIQNPDLEGIVEDISFRSCRIRTFDDALVSVPNSQLANNMITNWSKMKTRKLLVYIGLTYQTTQDQLERCIQRIRENLQANDSVDHNSIHVYFHSMNSMNMDFRVQCNIYNNGFGPFLKIREEIHYDILRIVREEGLTIASMPLFQEGIFPKK